MALFLWQNSLKCSLSLHIVKKLLPQTKHLRSAIWGCIFISSRHLFTSLLPAIISWYSKTILQKAFSSREVFLSKSPTLLCMALKSVLIILSLSNIFCMSSLLVCSHILLWLQHWKYASVQTSCAKGSNKIKSGWYLNQTFLCSRVHIQVGI